jgi:hypothetical protein
MEVIPVLDPEISVVKRPGESLMDSYSLDKVSGVFSFSVFFEAG